jgi:ferritin-like metal-binding protein YciE
LPEWIADRVEAGRDEAGSLCLAALPRLEQAETQRAPPSCMSRDESALLASVRPAAMACALRNQRRNPRLRMEWPKQENAMPEKNLRELFHNTLKGIYFAEKKILTALPKMAKAAQSDELKAAFQKHERETEGHVERLDEIFAEIDAKPRGKTCDAILGIIEEGQEVMKEYRGAPALDAGLLAAAQAVEHYEIARYGTLRTWAQELGLTDAVELLDATLAEEKKTDETLTQLAESHVNEHAEAA